MNNNRNYQKKNQHKRYHQKRKLYKRRKKQSERLQQKTLQEGYKKIVTSISLSQDTKMDNKLSINLCNHQLHNKYKCNHLF